MTVGVVGLGLIGGSFVKAYHEAGERVLVWNRSATTRDFALLSGDADGVLDEESCKYCDLILLCIYPEAAIRWLEDFAPHLGAHSVVMDSCGTKRVVCEACFPLAERHGFTYIGVTPWRGRIFPVISTPAPISTTARRWCSSRRRLTISSCSTA